MYAEFLGVWPEVFLLIEMLLILVRAKHTYFPVKKKKILENSNSFLVKTATDRKQKFGDEIHIIEICFYAAQWKLDLTSFWI